MLRFKEIYRMLRSGEIKVKENWVIVLKTITYRSTSSMLTFLVAWGATGSAKTGGLIMLFRGFLGMIWYMTHEKIWYWLKRKFNLP